MNSVPAAGVRAMQGQYVVSQLNVWCEMAIAILELPGVTAVDLAEARNRVAIGIEDKSRTRAVERALSAIAIPRHAVTIQVTEKIGPVCFTLTRRLSRHRWRSELPKHALDDRH
jgi:hypothetical protein